MTERKRIAALQRLAKQRAHLAGLAMGPTIVTPTPAAYLSSRRYVADFAFIHQDESVVQDALQRLTYVHRIDHAPEVDDWAVVELLFRLDHIEELSNRQQEAATHRVNAWMALGHEDTPETWG